MRLDGRLSSYSIINVIKPASIQPKSAGVLSGRSLGPAPSGCSPSERKEEVTGFYQKYKSPNVDHPDFWVLAAMSESRDRFFVLTHEEMERTQCKRNCPGEDLGWEEAAIRSTNGVDNVLLPSVIDHEDRWDKIARHVRASL
jgi:hypothetical protein